MHRTLRDLASPGNSALYSNIQINDDTSVHCIRHFDLSEVTIC